MYPMSNLSTLNDLKLDGIVNWFSNSVRSMVPFLFLDGAYYYYGFYV